MNSKNATGHSASSHFAPPLKTMHHPLQIGYRKK